MTPELITETLTILDKHPSLAFSIGLINKLRATGLIVNLEPNEIADILLEKKLISHGTNGPMYITGLGNTAIWLENSLKGIIAKYTLLDIVSYNSEPWTKEHLISLMANQCMDAIAINEIGAIVDAMYAVGHLKAHGTMSGIELMYELYSLSKIDVKIFSNTFSATGIKYADWSTYLLHHVLGTKRLKPIVIDNLARKQIASLYINGYIRYDNYDIEENNLHRLFKLTSKGKKHITRTIPMFIRAYNFLFRRLA